MNQFMCPPPMFQNPKPQHPQVMPPDLSSRLHITPRELLSLPFSDLSAVILDIRKHPFPIVPNDFYRTVISIPTRGLHMGLTFTGFLSKLPLVSQNLMPRVFASDYVVILADKDPPLLDGNFKPKSPVHTISKALNELSTQKLKNPLLYLAGGFKQLQKGLSNETFVQWKRNNLYNQGVISPEYSGASSGSTAPAGVVEIWETEEEYNSRIERERGLQEQNDISESDTGIQSQLTIVNNEVDDQNRAPREPSELEARLQEIVTRITEENDSLKRSLLKQNKISDSKKRIQSQLILVNHEFENLKKQLNDAEKTAEVNKELAMNLLPENETLQKKLKTATIGAGAAANVNEGVPWEEIQSLQVYKEVVDKMCSNLVCPVCLQVSFKYRVCTSGKHIASCLDCAPPLGNSCPICRQGISGLGEAIFEDAAAFLLVGKLEISKGDAITIQPIPVTLDENLMGNMEVNLAERLEQNRVEPLSPNSFDHFVSQRWSSFPDDGKIFLIVIAVIILIMNPAPLILIGFFVLLIR